jgi:hypothetical protein
MSDYLVATRASALFRAIVLLTLGVCALIGLVLLQPELVARVAGPQLASHISQHFRQPDHRVHDLTFAFVFGTAVVGMLAQLRTPSANIAGQLLALVPWLALVVVFALANTFPPFAPLPLLAALTLVATLVHPGDAFRRVLNARDPSRVLLVLLVVAAGPLLALAVFNIGLQRTVSDEHAALGHYGFMAAFSLTLLGASFLASLRPPGYWLAAWVAGLLAALLGLTSLVFADLDSALDTAWAVAAIAWGLVFVTTAELTQTAQNPTVFGSWAGRFGQTATGAPVARLPGGAARPSAPRWLYLAGTLAILLAVLLVGLHLSGGAAGPAGHLQPGGPP